MERSPLNRCNVSLRHPSCTGTRSRSRRSGFTLVEAVICTLLVGLVAVASLKTSAAVVRSRQKLSDTRLATALCERYLSEILQSYYQDPTALPPVFGLESGESLPNRSNFDDVDDYSGWNESPPKHKNGSALTGYADWSVNIEVAYVDPATPNGSPSADLGLKRVTVTVTDPSIQQVVLKGLRAKAGADEKAPFVQTNHVQWIGLDLRTKDAATTLRGGTQPIDQARIGN